MIREYVLKINPNFTKWDELEWLLAQFEEWEADPAEPPSSGAFLCASKANDLVGGWAAFLACSGDKHLPFEKVISRFKKGVIWSKGNTGIGFGHPVYAYDPRVSEYFFKFPPQTVDMSLADRYSTHSPCLNFAGLFGVWCKENELDERAAILPIISRLLGLSADYQYNKKLPSTYDSIKIGPISLKSKD